MRARWRNHLNAMPLCQLLLSERIDKSLIRAVIGQKGIVKLARVEAVVAYSPIAGCSVAEQSLTEMRHDR